MTEPTDPIPSSADLADQIDPSREELADFHELFAKALDALENPDDINAALSHSERPDLVIKTPVKLMSLDSIEDTHFEKLNNFIPHLVHTVEAANARTTEDWQAFFDTWGAKGSVEEYMEIGSSQGSFSKGIGMLMHTDIAKPALTRMWILFPELSRMLFGAVGDRDTSGLRSGNDISSVQQEFFVAYNIMARLVDEADPEVLREDEETGSIAVDELYLYR